MSQLRFVCPSCGQNIECEKAYGGHVIHCPNCCAEIRIPFANNLPSELNIPKAQLIVESPAVQKAAASNESTHREFICPVCRSELRIPTDPHSLTQSGPTTAELVHQTQAPEPVKPPAGKPPPEEKPVAPGPVDPHKSHTEHEQEIAAARAARPIQTYPSAKPRLSYILGEKSEPPPDDGKSFTE